MSGLAMISRESANSASTRSGSAPQTETIPTLFQQALSLHQQNRLSEAETLYRRILDAEPNHHGALHFLGMVALEQRKYDVAIPCLVQALRLCTTNAVYHNNYGIAILRYGDKLEARKAFENALTLDPHYADAWSNFGAILMELNGTPNEIGSAFQNALDINSGHRDALRHLSEFYSLDLFGNVNLAKVEKLVLTYLAELG